MIGNGLCLGKRAVVVLNREVFSPSRSLIAFTGLDGGPRPGECIGREDSSIHRA